MKDYKEHGFCLSIGEWDRNINSAGVPIHLQDGTIMALTCAAPSYLVPAEKTSRFHSAPARNAGRRYRIAGCLITAVK